MEIIKMPKMSDVMTEGVVTKWYKKVGDKVKSGDVLAEVETDKATMDFESFQDGIILYIGVEEGKTVPVDAVIAVLGKEGEDFTQLIPARFDKKNSVSKEISDEKIVFSGLNNLADETKSPLINKQTIKIFLASSSELKEEREKFEIFIGRENKRLNGRGFFLHLEIWEDFLDAVSKTRLQDEYNLAISKCDIFVMLFFTKVGKFTAEEFEKAFKNFRETQRPKIYTYFKTGSIKSASVDREHLKSLWDFQDKLKELGHFQTEFETNSDLHLHFKNQLEKLYDF